MFLQTDYLGKVAITVDKNPWDRNKCYDRLTLVKLYGQNSIYVSLRPVPENISIADTKYWFNIIEDKEGTFNITIDNELKDSNNPVANKVIWLAIDNLKHYIDGLIVGDGSEGIDASILDTYATLVYVKGLASTIKDEINQTLREKLIDYYLKSETYNKEEVDELISVLPKFKLEVVDSLPTSEIDNQTVYVVKSQEDDIYYKQWIYKDNAWKLLGEARLNLEGYALKTEVEAVMNILVTKQDVLISGRNIKTINGESILGEGNLIISSTGGESGEKCDCPKHIFLTQVEYDALETKEKNVLYFIIKSKSTSWVLGDELPMILSDGWVLGDNLPMILRGDKSWGLDDGFPIILT